MTWEDEGVNTILNTMLLMFSLGPTIVFGGCYLINRYNEERNETKRQECIAAVYAAPNHMDTLTMYRTTSFDAEKILYLRGRNGHVFPHVVHDSADNAFAVRQTEPDDKLLVQATSLHNLRVVQNITKNKAMKQFSKQH